MKLENDAKQVSSKRLFLVSTVEFVLTVLAVIVIPNIADRLKVLYGNEAPNCFFMPWILLLFIPNVVVLIDFVLTRIYKGKFLKFYLARHGFYLFLMVACFLYIFRFMLITITT